MLKCLRPISHPSFPLHVQRSPKMQEDHSYVDSFSQLKWHGKPWASARVDLYLICWRNIACLFCLLFFFLWGWVWDVSQWLAGHPSVVDIRSLFFSGHGGWLHSTSGPSTDASSMHLLFNSQNWCLHFESFECYWKSSSDSAAFTLTWGVRIRVVSHGVKGSRTLFWTFTLLFEANTNSGCLSERASLLFLYKEA